MKKDKKSRKYDISGLVQAQYEPGSHGRVLKNKLGIKRKREMDQLEAIAQLQALDKITNIYDKNHQFTVVDICKIHKIWLGEIYEWAGQYRMVNASKDNFSFATSKFIPTLMEEFEKEHLRAFTPCIFKPEDEIIKALATVHTELVLIHPFREGNGRCARLLATLMALQAGLPVLDFGSIKGKKRQEYFLAVRAGLDKSYEPMMKIFKTIIQRTNRSYKK